MSFPRYPAYKDSGVEWLGEVPTHWTVAPIKRRYSVVGGSTPKSDSPAYWDGDIVWITPADLSRLRGFEIIESIRTITSEGLDSCGTTLVPPGSIVLSTRAPIGSLGIATRQLCTNQGCKALVPRDDDESRYLAYLLSVTTDELNIRGRGTTFLELSGDELGSFRIPCPPRGEKSLITAFLDRETAKIDALIAEQERLIELLKEKRQAVISHAVTKGLDPDVPMKDSGVEWLGKVPAHWNVTALRRQCRTITDGAHISPDTENGVYCFVSTKDIAGSSIDFDDCLKTSPESYDYLVRTGCQPLSGDVLFSKDGTIGRTVVVHERRDFVVASSLIIIRPAPDLLNSSFLNYACQSRIMLEQVEGLVKGAGLPRLSIRNLLKVIGVFPPLIEQQAIVAFLDRETTRIDELLSEMDAALGLLTERRSALISAAVTGQIDVRGLVDERIKVPSQRDCSGLLPTPLAHHGVPARKCTTGTS